MTNANNRGRSVMTAEDIEKVVSGEIKIKPNQVGVQRHGSLPKYHHGYRPPRKTILGSNGSSF